MYKNLVDIDIPIDSPPVAAATTSHQQASASIDLSDLEARLAADAVRTPQDVSGTMASSQAHGAQSSTVTPTDYDRQFDTLDEPVWHTIRRDLSAVGNKLRHVFIPVNNRTLLKEWDLWGPLFLCVLLSV